MSNINIQSGVIFGKNLQEMFNIAKNKNFAIPAINCSNIDSINAVLESASLSRSPVIIQFSNDGSSFIAGRGLKNNQNRAVLGAVAGAKHVHHLAKYYDVPVILHTDHCSKKLLPWLDGLLDAGEKYYFNTGRLLFSSHMIDLSSESIEENVKISSEYFSRMKKLNIMLEVEIGSTGGEEDGVDNRNIKKSKLYTHPKDVSYMYEKLSTISSNFTIAAAFGNVHGVYKSGNIKLIPKILDRSQKYISKKFNIPKKSVNFVFHGGSGSSISEIREAINYGVVKVNIDTDIQWSFWNGILKYYKENMNYLQAQLGSVDQKDMPNKKFYDPRSWIRSGQISIIEYLKSIFKKTNSFNKIR